MRRVVTALTTVMALWTVGCGGSDGDPGGPPDPTPTPDFVLQVSPTALEVVAGGQGAAVPAATLGETTLNVSVTRSGGFSGAVTVTVSGLPTGVTSTSLEIGAAQGAGTIILTAAAQAATGASTLNVSASGTGVTTKTATVALTVAEPVPSFDVTFAFSSTSIVLGATTPVSLTIDRSGGFTGEVAFSATSTPSGLGLSFDPATTTGTAATLNISAGAGLTPGDYAVEVTATGGGRQSTASLTVAVNEPSGSGNTTVSFCPQTGVPAWVAFQDGTSAWLQAAQSAPLEWTFEMAAAKGAVAYVFLDGDDADLYVYYGSQAELNSFSGVQCVDRKSLTGSFAGVTSGENASVSLSGGSAFWNGFGASDFTMDNVAEGPGDLVANLTALQADGMGGFELIGTRVIIRRNVDYPAGSQIPVIDFSAEGFPPTRHALTVTNQLGHATSATTIYSTARSQGSLLFANPTAATHYFGVPDQLQETGDIHITTGLAISTNGGVTVSRGVTSYHTLARDLVLNLGPLMTGVALSTAATSPYVRPRAQFDIQAAHYDRFWSAGFAAVSGNQATLFMFEGYEPGGTFDRAVPDFSGVAGWNDDWGLPNETLFYNVNATGWTTTGGPNAPPVADGTISKVVGESGTMNP